MSSYILASWLMINLHGMIISIISLRGSASECTVSGSWNIFMLTKESSLCFMNLYLLVNGDIFCNVGVGTLDKGKDKITRIVNQTGRMIAEPLQNLEDVRAHLLITKLIDVMDDGSHPLHDCFMGQLISKIWLHMRAFCFEWQISFLFVPQAIKIHSANFQRGHNLHWCLICFSFISLYYLWVFIMNIISIIVAIQFHLTWCYWLIDWLIDCQTDSQVIHYLGWYVWVVNLLLCFSVADSQTWRKDNISTKNRSQHFINRR